MVNTAAIDRWELRFALHQTLETALISPLNLFKLSEVFFPRRHDIIISPVSVQVTYNLTCQEPTNCSLQTENDSFCGDGGYIASYFWTSLPIHRTDPYTFSILESFSQRHFGRTVPLVELSLEVKSLPCSISEQDVRDELLCISAMVSPKAFSYVLTAALSACTCACGHLSTAISLSLTLWFASLLSTTVD